LVEEKKIGILSSYYFVNLPPASTRHARPAHAHGNPETGRTDLLATQYAHPLVARPSTADGTCEERFLHNYFLSEDI
jgi:hypothetical protein